MTTTTLPDTDSLTTSPTATAPAIISKRKIGLRWTIAQKAECVAQFRSSGLNQRDFERERNMPPGNLSRWLRRHGAGNAATNREDGPLVEIPLAALGEATLGNCPVRLYLPSGVKLEIAAGTNTAWLGQLLNTLLPCSA
jgi:hypothetical protein